MKIIIWILNKVFFYHKQVLNHKTYDPALDICHKGSSDKRYVFCEIARRYL